MASIQKFSNNFSTTLIQNASPASSNLYLDQIDGLPDISGGNFCKLTIRRESDGQIEIVRVTYIDDISNFITVTRGEENTTPLSFVVDDTVHLRLTAEPINDLVFEVDRLTTSETSLLQAAVDAEAAATNAALSETNAQASADAAGLSETNAQTSETNSALSESNAQSYATSADNARIAAEAAQTATELVYDNFDDRYLGEYASDPITDNDGDPLVSSTLYFNTTEGMKVYNGSSWEIIGVASAVPQDSPTGAADIPTGTTAQRPSVPSEGMFRRNSETGEWEGYDGATWGNIGGTGGGAAGGSGYFGDGTYNVNNLTGDDPHWLEITNNPGDGANGNQLFRLNSYGNISYGNNVHFCRYFGDETTPTAIGDNAFLMSFGFRGHDGTGLSQSAAAFQCIADGAWTTSNHGTRFNFDATPQGSATRERVFQVASDGISVGAAEAATGWHTNYEVAQVSQKGSGLRGHKSQPEITLSNNAFYDTGYKFGTSGYASIFQLDNAGGFTWRSSSASGTTGAAATLNEVMSLDASGNLDVSNTITSTNISDGTTTTTVTDLANSPGLVSAWVNFNGTGTVAIRNSFNVSSITDGGTGNYTANFTTALSNTTYAATGSSGSYHILVVDRDSESFTRTTTQFQMRTTDLSFTAGDSNTVSLVITGG